MHLFNDSKEDAIKTFSTFSNTNPRPYSPTIFKNILGPFLQDWFSQSKVVLHSNISKYKKKKLEKKTKNILKNGW